MRISIGLHSDGVSEHGHDSFNKAEMKGRGSTFGEVSSD